ncbi:hypothetical protein EDB82DRAFT_437293, partial [Fusarium venenatum]|uniref:uncharacterized protein n=1 Tax=Fusarium venenatum TaxID=56646 RepID=UPI001DE35742
YVAPYEPSDNVYPRLNAEMHLEAHEILHHLRGILESQHRATLYTTPANHPLTMAELPQLERYRALDFFNKTVPIYMLRGDKKTYGLAWPFFITLHNYLYKMWFRPYRSEIERGQFITKALLIVIPAKSYCNCSSIEDISTMTALILLTGENDGLSSPISFESVENEVEKVVIRGMHGVRTRLEVAVDFAMFLEQREDAVFGPQPDPVASTASDTEELDGPMYCYEKSQATESGWKYGPIVGPSSKWVSMERYPKWTGWGARVEFACYKKKEERDWRFHKQRCTCYLSQKTEEVNEEVTI